MKRLKLTHVIPLILLIVAACDEPETVVTDIVHPDGSVTRKIEMRSSKNKFEKSVLQVPFDSTWTICDTLEVGIKGDTTWIKRAEKLFPDIDGINAAYKCDSSSNGKYPRHASFSRRFRWFNTSYRFSEIIDSRLINGHSIRNFLNDEELIYFYSPANLKFSKEHGPDSLKYQALADTIDTKTLSWNLWNVTDMWIDEFSALVGRKGGDELSAESLRGREDKIVEVLEENKAGFDSLWSAGVLLGKIIGEKEAQKFKNEADSALSVAINNLIIDYKNYSVRIVMPGKLTATNGYIDSTGTLLWPVNADLFLSDRYEMWAGSKRPNIWAWIVSGAFLIFVTAGIVLKRKSRLRNGI